MSRLTSVIYPSLPPYVSGEATGELILSSGRLQLSNIPSPHLAHISFKWWGQHEDPVILQYGTNAKAIFPLRTDLSSLQTYLADMHELKIDVYQSDELLGFSTIPLRHIINTKVNAEVTCPIKSKSRNTSIGHFTLRFVAKYRNTTTTPITKIDLTSTTPTKSEKKISDFSRVEVVLRALIMCLYNLFRLLLLQITRTSFQNGLSTKKQCVTAKITTSSLSEPFRRVLLFLPHLLVDP